jgi:hypothetical protein
MFVLPTAKRATLARALSLNDRGQDRQRPHLSHHGMARATVQSTDRLANGEAARRSVPEGHDASPGTSVRTASSMIAVARI